ncbi:MAG: signal peptidase I [Oscillospiraceae bacterium]|nr:signal peptidase I [Oscillospiraceae bacterium]
MNIVKKVILGILNAISIALIVFAVVALLIVVTTRSGEAPNFFGYSMFRVLTGSMEPELPVGSMVIVKRVGAEEVKVGDIITFFSTDPTLQGGVNTHRVIDIDNSGMDILFTTKGDANQFKDEYGAVGSNLIGVVIYCSTFLGTAVRLASNPVIFFPLLVIPLGIILISNLVSTVKTAKKLAAEEEEKAIAEIIAKHEKNKNSENKG